MARSDRTTALILAIAAQYTFAVFALLKSGEFCTGACVSVTSFEDVIVKAFDGVLIYNMILLGTPTILIAFLIYGALRLFRKFTVTRQ